MELGPAQFDCTAIDMETLAFIRDLERQLAANPSVMDVPPAQTRAARERGEGFWRPLTSSARARDLAIPGPGGDLMLRVVPPQGEPVGAYLHFHGGGWVFGSSHYQDPLLEEVADRCKLVIVSVDYRLAPEHPYPAATDDAEAAALWLAEKALAEFGVEQLVIGGESAGANLSVAAMVRLRDRHGFTGFAATNLVSGVFDLGMTPSLRNWGQRNLVLNTPLMTWFIDQYIGEGEVRRSPDVSPLYARLVGLPPALFTIGTLDPLLDDTLFQAARWTAAENDAELAIYPGGIHTFWYFDTELGRRARERIATFFLEALT